MSCVPNCKCRVCENLVSTVAIVDNETYISLILPQGLYYDCRKLCILIAQNIPVPTDLAAPLPVVVEFDGLDTRYVLVNCNGKTIYSDQLCTRKIYCFMMNTDDSDLPCKPLLYVGMRLPCSKKLFPRATVVPAPSTPVTPDTPAPTAASYSAPVNNESKTNVKKVGE